MLPMRYGYACINMELSYPRKFNKPRGTKKVTMSPSMIRRTFDAKGIAYASELAPQNVQDFRPFLDGMWQMTFTFSESRQTSSRGPRT